MVCDPGHPDVSGEPSCGVSPVKPAQPTITLSLTVSDLTTPAPLKGHPVKACARDDGDCGAPLATETTDAAGKVSVTVPSGTDGFDGYAMITGDNVVPELLFPSPPVTMDAEFFTGVATPNSLNLLSIIYGTTIDPSRGAVAAVMSDCDGKSVGLTLDVGSADGCTVIGYAENQLPSADAKATDASGVGFALNIPPGRPTLVSRDGNGAVLGRTEILVKPSTLTAVSLRPTP